MPFLLFMPVKIGTFYNTSVQSPTVENLYNEASPMKEFLRGLYMVCHENTFFSLWWFVTLTIVAMSLVLCGKQLTFIIFTVTTKEPKNRRTKHGYHYRVIDVKTLLSKQLVVQNELMHFSFFLCSVDEVKYFFFSLHLFLFYWTKPELGFRWFFLSLLVYKKKCFYLLRESQIHAKDK